MLDDAILQHSTLKSFFFQAPVYTVLLEHVHRRRILKAGQTSRPAGNVMKAKKLPAYIYSIYSH